MLPVGEKIAESASALAEYTHEQLSSSIEELLVGYGEVAEWVRFDAEEFMTVYVDGSDCEDAILQAAASGGEPMSRGITADIYRCRNRERPEITNYLIHSTDCDDMGFRPGVNC